MAWTETRQPALLVWIRSTLSMEMQFTALAQVSGKLRERAFYIDYEFRRREALSQRLDGTRSGKLARRWLRAARILHENSWRLDSTTYFGYRTGQLGWSRFDGTSLDLSLTPCSDVK